MRLFTPAILRISANGISNLLDESWMEGHFYFIAEEAAKSNKSVFHKTIREGFLYYLGTEVYNEYLRPHNVIGYGAERSDELYLYLYSGLVELIDFLSYHELETKNLGIRLDRYIEELLEEYDRTGNTKIGTIEYNGNLKKAWMYLLEKNSSILADLKYEYASRFAERVFHDREMCEYISRQLQFSRYGWGTYGTNHTDEKPAQWIKREKWPKWVERAIQARDRGNCAICGKSIILESGQQNIDHIVSLAQGGTNDLINLQLTCPECNSEKSSSTKSVESSVPKYLGIDTIIKRS